MHMPESSPVYITWVMASVFLYRQELLKTLEADVKRPNISTDEQAVALKVLLKEFPYLFGYWLRLVKLDNSCWEQAVAACPSLELWVAWCKEPDVSEERYKRAAAAVGPYFRSHTLWDGYLALVDRLDPSGEKRAFVLRKLIDLPIYEYSKYLKQAQLAAASHPKIFQDVDFPVQAGILKGLVSEKWKFESKLTRHYFHVIPLKDEELNTWDEYLTWSEGNESPGNTENLYNRALVSLALYTGFWLKYSRWLWANNRQMLNECFKQALFWADQKSEQDSRAAKEPIVLQHSLYLEALGEIGKTKELLHSLSQQFLDETQALKFFRSRTEGSVADVDQTQTDDRDTFDFASYFQEDILKNGSAAAKELLQAKHRS